MDFLAFWVRCLVWSFWKTERAEGTVTTLAVLGLNWAALAQTLAVPLGPRWIGPAFLGLMLLVIAPWRVHRLIDDRRVMDTVKVWEKNAALQEQLNKMSRAISGGSPRATVAILPLRDPPRLLVSNSGSKEWFWAQAKIVESNTGETGESVHAQWDRNKSDKVEIPNGMEQELIIDREGPGPSLPPLFGTITIDGGVTTTSTGGRFMRPDEPSIVVEVRIAADRMETHVSRYRWDRDGFRVAPMPSGPHT